MLYGYAKVAVGLASHSMHHRLYGISTCIGSMACGRDMSTLPMVLLRNRVLSFMDLCFVTWNISID